MNILWTLFYTTIVGYFFFMNLVTFQKNSIEKIVIYLNESHNVTNANVSKIMPFFHNLVYISNVLKNIISEWCKMTKEV